MAKKRLFLIDGNAFSYRAYYAVGTLMTSRGQPTGAVFGFLNMLHKLREQEHPDFLAVCFDAPGPTHRHQAYDEYKKNRKPMPEDLREQMRIIMDILDAYGIRHFALSGYEADDIIATFTRRFQGPVEVVIASSDKDMLQLINEYVKIYHPQGAAALVDADYVYRKFRVPPNLIADLLALAGDGSDNIPGIPGVGPKTAAELLNEYGGLDGIFANTAQIKSARRRTLLQENEQNARLSKELATLRFDVPLPCELDELSPQPANMEKLRQWFRTLEFHNFPAGGQPAPETGADMPISTVGTPAEIAGMLRRIEPANKIAMGIVPALTAQAEPGLCLAWTRTDAVMIQPKADMSWTELAPALTPLLQKKQLLKIGYDIQSILNLLFASGADCADPFFDVMVAAYLLAPEKGTQSLSDIVGAAADTPFANISALLDLQESLENRLREIEVWELFSEVETPLIRILSRMHAVGIAVDTTLLERSGREFDRRLEELSGKIFAIAGEEFNINSPKQLGTILFERLGLPVVKKGKTGPSTDSEVLTRLAQKHELPQYILEYRELAKLRSTYVDGLLTLVNSRTGRVHTTFTQAVTATGRLSSRDPNLQNIPVRTDVGKQIRSAFVAGNPGIQLLSADYSQIELRILAHLSGETKLIEAFSRGQDIHTYTAALIFGTSDDRQVNAQMRDIAKRVNFGIIYGMGAYGLARDIQISPAEAGQFIENYFLRYPGVRTYLDQIIERARQTECVWTMFHRRRALPEINAKNQSIRAFAERVAMNAPIQGTAADMIKIAMVRLPSILARHRLQARLLLQVHDELLWEVPAEELALTAEVVKTAMENVVPLRVPVVVNIKSGSNWRDMH